MSDTTGDESTVIPATSDGEADRATCECFLLDLLRDHISLTLADAADELAAVRHDRPVECLGPETVADAYFDLYYRVLPPLCRVGRLTYDQETDLVSLPGLGADADSLPRTPPASFDAR